MTIFGVDVSSFQGAGFNFTQAAQQGISFAIVKATEGDNYANPYYATQVQNSINAGLVTMSYHFVHSADENGQVAEMEANVRKDLPLWLDSEVDGSGEYAVSVDLVRRLRADGWNVVGTYLPHWFWSQIGSPDLRPLLLSWASGYPGGTGSPAQIYAQSGGDNGSGWASYGGVAPTLWQFTDKASVGGQQVDCSAFKGTLSQLKGLVSMALTQDDANLVVTTLLNWALATPSAPAGTAGRPVWDVLGDGERIQTALKPIATNTTPPIKVNATATVDPTVLQNAVQAAVQAAVPAIAQAVQAQLDAERVQQLNELGFVPKTS